MTVKIEIEALLPWSVDDFRKAVVAHAEAMREYAEHLRGVEEDAANADLKPEDRRVAFPPPSAHPLVEVAVKAGGYDLVGPPLEVRKQRLSAEVDAAEQAEIAKVMPQRKARYWQMHEQDIRAADNMIVSNHPVPVPHDQITSFLRAKRPADDTAFLDDQQKRRERVASVQRWAAKAHHDIDNLTEETIDGWKLEPFVG